MTLSINHATPRPIFTGLKDESARNVTAAALTTPQHLPYFYAQFERGREVPQWITTNLSSNYGAASFNARKQWFSHATQGLTNAIGAGNMCLVKRVCSAGAKKGNILFSLELVAKTFKPFQRDASGAVVVDGNGVKQINTSGLDVTGFIGRWIISHVADPSTIAATAIVSPGTLTGDSGAVSSVYPIHFLEADSKGKWGDNVGVRFSFPHAKSSAPGDLSAMEASKANIYRMQIVERENENRSPVIVENLLSSQATDFAYEPDTLNPATDRVYEARDIIESYRSLEAGFEQVYGLLDTQHVFQHNIDTITKLLGDVERTAGPVSTIADAEMNIFSAVNRFGNPHYGFRMDASSAPMNTVATHYLKGGDDGIVSEAELDSLVRSEVMTNWDNPEYPIEETLRYPISAIYDTGFSLSTKKAMLALMGIRPDIYVTVCTQDLAQPENDVATEQSVLVALRAAARLTPESTIHGTSACRATIYGQMGELKGSPSRRRLPLVMEIITKRARYMGAADGKMKTEYAYDRGSNRDVTTMTNVSNTYKSGGVRESDFANGLNTAIYKDMNTLFWPAFQSVYDNPTSVLNSEIVMAIAVDVTKQHNIVWAALTGDTTLSPGEFLDASNTLITDLTSDRYDSRVDVVPNTYYTGADEQRGYSWTADSTIFANVMKSVATMIIRTQRRV